MIQRFKTINSAKASVAMQDWIRSKRQPDLRTDYELVRDDIIDLYKEVTSTNTPLSSYQIDIRFGIKLKEYLDTKAWFNLRTAANVGFWRYLSVMVVPRIVGQRWGDTNEDHFWKKPMRIWLRTIWWYAYLSWKGDAESTLKILGSKNFNTDTILNLVERSGRNGTDIELYRSIMLAYSKVSSNAIDEFKKTSKDRDSLFRAVMRLNTARILVMEPLLCDGGTDGYVAGLFKSFGIDV